MFHIAKNGIITVNRGDTFTLPIFVNLGTPLEPEIFDLREGDQVIFRIVRANDSFENAIIEKVCTIEDLNEEGSLNINFETEDTSWIEPNLYYYEVKLEYLREDKFNVKTFIPRTKFYIVD